MHELAITSAARRDLRRLPRDVASRIDAAILALRETPRPVGSIKLSGNELYRIRVGDYRILYAIDDQLPCVTVARVRHRRDVYDNL